MPRCPGCGAECEEGANFCGRCGASVRPAIPVAIARMIDDYRRALQDSPDDPNVHFQLGLAYKQAGLDEAAVQSFLRVCELEPTFADAHYELGAAYHRLGRPGEAGAPLRRAIELDPTHPGAPRLLQRLSGSA